MRKEKRDALGSEKRRKERKQKRPRKKRGKRKEAGRRKMKRKIKNNTNGNGNRIERSNETIKIEKEGKLERKEDGERAAAA